MGTNATDTGYTKVRLRRLSFVHSLLFLWREFFHHDRSSSVIVFTSAELLRGSRLLLRRHRPKFQRRIPGYCTLHDEGYGACILLHTAVYNARTQHFASTKNPSTLLNPFSGCTQTRQYPHCENHVSILSFFFIHTINLPSYFHCDFTIKCRDSWC